MLGIKQDALAFDLGEDWNQKKISLLEQKEIIYFFKNETIIEIDPFVTFTNWGIKLKVHKNDIETVKIILNKLNES